MKKRSSLLLAAALAASTCVCATAPSTAQDRYRERDYGRGGPPMQFDRRYHHDHYYPARGYAFASLPGGSIRIGYRGGDYWYHGGVWFRPDGGRFVVAAPPIGIFVPVLPPDYATINVNGAPYYYANGAYYAPAPGQGYAVVEPPPGTESSEQADGYAARPEPPLAANRPQSGGEPVVCPRNGQPSGQVEADKTDCLRWATQNSVGGDANVFQRAFGACMDGRGYSVR